MCAGSGPTASSPSPCEQAHWPFAVEPEAGIAGCALAAGTLSPPTATLVVDLYSVVSASCCFGEWELGASAALRTACGALVPWLSMFPVLFAHNGSCRRKKPDGSMDLFTWTAGVPGEAGTPWEGGVYKLNLYFPEDFPAKPPKCQFDPPLFHPNVYPSGTICLSILNAEKGWEPSHSVLQVLKGVQLLLNTPNLDDPAQREAYDLMR